MSESPLDSLDLEIANTAIATYDAEFNKNGIISAAKIAMGRYIRQAFGQRTSGKDELRHYMDPPHWTSEERAAIETLVRRIERDDSWSGGHCGEDLAESKTRHRESDDRAAALRVIKNLLAKR